MSSKNKMVLSPKHLNQALRHKVAYNFHNLEMCNVLARYSVVDEGSDVTSCCSDILFGVHTRNISIVGAHFGMFV